MISLAENCGNTHLRPLRALFAAALLIIAAPLSAADISGKVRDASTGNTLASMTVALYDSSGSPVASSPTDKNGSYKISPAPAGSFRILAFDPAGVYATEFGPGADSFESSPFVSAPATIDFSLTRGASVSGTVNTSSGAAGGVTVAAYNLSGSRRTFTTTSSNGSYSMVLPPGQYKFAAYDDGGTFIPMFYANAFTWTNATVVSAGSNSVSFTLSRASYLPGVVTDRTSGARLSGIYVYAYTPAGVEAGSTITDGTGRYAIRVAAGEYRIIAADISGRYAKTYGGNAQSFAKEPTTAVAEGQTAAETPLAMDVAGRISGRVTDASGLTLNGIHVVAYNIDGTPRDESRSDSSGNYTLAVAPGTYRIGAYDENLGYATQFYSRNTRFTDATNVVVTSGGSAPGFDFALTRAARLSGRITNAGTGAPLAGITVAAYDSTRTLITSAVSNADGQYTLAAPEGAFTIAAWDSSHAFATMFDGGATSFETTPARLLSASAAQGANFAMIAAVALTGTVRNSSNTALPAIEVWALDGQGNHIASAMTGDDGRFVLALAPGSYKIFANDPSQRYAPSFYDRASTLSTASAIVIVSGSSPAPLNLVLAQTSTRRRAAAH